MTVIVVAVDDPGTSGQNWTVPPELVLRETPIPRGLRNYNGTAAIAALGSGDQTSVLIRLNFPIQYVYLPKTVNLIFQSDDGTTEFGDIGSLEYRPGGSQDLGTRVNYAFTSPGQAFRGAFKSMQSYTPQGQWRRFVMGNKLDTLNLIISDQSGDTSTAGDVAWSCEFWEYDIEQCFQWPINTPFLQVSY